MEHIFSQRIGVWGFGVVGQSVVRFARSRGCTNVMIIDKKQSVDASLSPVDRPFVQFLIESPETIDHMLTSCDFIVPSPGVDLRAYQAYAHKFIFELDIFNYYATSSIIAITGSVGKTTITTLLGSLLSQADFSNKTAGNIGNGMLDLLTEASSPDYCVLEVSSFQLESIENFSPHIAIISNIYPNHLDRHGSMQSYLQAKSRLLSFQNHSDYSILPWELKNYFLSSEKFPAHKIWHFSQELSEEFISRYDASEPLYAPYNGSIVRICKGSVKNIISLAQLPDISLVANWIILVATLESLRIKSTSLMRPDLQLNIPAHRIEHIGTYKSVSFYNDSKSTIPAATLAAIEKLNSPQLILFIGGVSKGVDRAPFIQSLKGKVKSLYCFGSEARQLAWYAQTHNLTAHSFENLEQAVAQYLTEAQTNDSVLFSPAGASFDLFTNYQHRGECFKHLIHTYIEKTG